MLMENIYSSSRRFIPQMIQVPQVSSTETDINDHSLVKNLPVELIFYKLVTVKENMDPKLYVYKLLYDGKYFSVLTDSNNVELKIEGYVKETLKKVIQTEVIIGYIKPPSFYSGIELDLIIEEGKLITRVKNQELLEDKASTWTE